MSARCALRSPPSRSWAGCSVSTSFPHTVSISVTERPPVAALLTAGQRTAVAADGTVLGPALLSSSLPTVSGSVEPSAGSAPQRTGRAGRGHGARRRSGAACRFVARVFNGPEGLTVAMRNGLLVYFGNATRPHAKWLSLARVLASPSAAGACTWMCACPNDRPPDSPRASSSSTTLARSPRRAGASGSNRRGARGEPCERCRWGAPRIDAAGSESSSSVVATSSSSESEVVLRLPPERQHELAPGERSLVARRTSRHRGRLT